ncbi:polysaccharide deacetylase family protein [Aquirufa sp. HETE-83D]|uniref:Polysaccharide deacetylase family protein n=1 Tax=Aquirufa esocilacus TaxID=3096513 RepID=A0ABW6DJ28_9BACT
MFIHQIPSFIPALLPRFTWSKAADRQIYLTFDDGPTPEITDFVLECLAEYEAKATFFCIGKNVVENSSIIQRIQAGGHSIGNHTMNHSNAWKMDYAAYVEDIQKCENVFVHQHIKSIGFRPPYGRITRNMYKELDNVILWSVLTGDYNAALTPDVILESVLPLLKPGAIVVMHDSVKAFPHLQVILPAILAYCKQQSFVLSAL